MHSDKIIVILHLLHFYVFPPQLSHHSLAVIGALSPNAAIFPLFEMQTRWYALLMAGKCQLPSRGEMLKNIEETDEKQRNILWLC
jgi:dimethylaniline monooxygenase (N-oxide forming)